MHGRRVVGRDGREWRIRRRWLPWEPRRRGNLSDDGLFGIDLSFTIASSGWGIVAIIALVVGLVLFAIFVLPVIITIFEIFLALLLVPFFVLARVILRRPWIVVASTKGPPPEQRAASVPGWRASREAMERLAQEIQMQG